MVFFQFPYFVEYEIFYLKKKIKQFFFPKHENSICHRQLVYENCPA